MKKKTERQCNFEESPMSEASEMRPFLVRMARIFPNKVFTLKSRIKYRFMKQTNRTNGHTNKAMETAPKVQIKDPLNLNVGDWVEVRSLNEIVKTLDDKGKFKGLYFMPEMEEFCGRRFKIFKKAEKIKLESNGELRKLRSPSYFLEGVHCTGVFQGGCDRACFHYWREEWLIKVSE